MLSRKHTRCQLNSFALSRLAAPGLSGLSDFSATTTRACLLSSRTCSSGTSISRDNLPKIPQARPRYERSFRPLWGDRKTALKMVEMAMRGRCNRWLQPQDRQLICSRVCRMEYIECSDLPIHQGRREGEIATYEQYDSR